MRVTGRDRVPVHLGASEDDGDGDRVGDVRLARAPLLPVVREQRHLEREAHLLLGGRTEVVGRLLQLRIVLCESRLQLLLIVQALLERVAQVRQPADDVAAPLQRSCSIRARPPTNRRADGYVIDWPSRAWRRIKRWALRPVFRMRHARPRASWSQRRRPYEAHRRGEQPEQQHSARTLVRTRAQHGATELAIWGDLVQ